MRPTVTVLVAATLFIAVNISHACDLSPVADLTANMDFGVIGERTTVTFDGSDSYDPDEIGGLDGIHRFEWVFEDNSTYYETPNYYPDGKFDGLHSRTYTQPGGPYDIVLTVYDSGGIHDSATFQLNIMDNIQAAINDASSGDIIVVSRGIYTGDDNRDIDFGGKAVELRSTDPNDPAIVAATIIDCDGSSGDEHRGFHFIGAADSGVILRGLTIRNGYASEGGAIFCLWADPKIEKCVIADNTAGQGGGIAAWGAEPVINNCVLHHNETYGAWPNGKGGGASFKNCVAGPIVTNCVFSENSANSGGGVHVEFSDAGR